MSLTTHFRFTKTTSLPLPPVKPPILQQRSTAPVSESPYPPSETPIQIRTRGLHLALSMLRSPPYMIMLNPLVQHYTRLDLADPKAHLVDLPRLAKEFGVRLSEPMSVGQFEESKNGEFVHYEIVDKLQVLGGLTSKLLTYRSAFRPLYSDPASSSRPPTSASASIPSSTSQHDLSTSIGLETISDPGSGVSLYGKWTVTIDDKDISRLVLREEVSVQCNILVTWFVRGQLESAHESLHREFARRFALRMVEGVRSIGPGEGGGEGISDRDDEDGRKGVRMRRAGTGESVGAGEGQRQAQSQSSQNGDGPGQEAEQHQHRDQHNVRAQRQRQSRADSPVSSLGSRERD